MVYNGRVAAVTVSGDIKRAPKNPFPLPMTPSTTIRDRVQRIRDVKKKKQYPRTKIILGNTFSARLYNVDDLRKLFKT